MLRLEFFGSRAELTLDRPPANAINAEWLARFHEALDTIEQRPQTAVVHLRSATRMFSAGADLHLMAASIESAAGVDAMLEVAERMQHAFDRLAALAPVTLAEIGGPALGGGFEMALACDLRVIAQDAVVGLPEVRLGLLPGAGGTQRMAMLCGAPVAKRLILGAETVRGAEAQALGLAQWSVPPAELAAYARDKADALAALPAAALAACKRCIDLAHPAQPAGYLKELVETRRLYASEPTQALVQQFIKRKR
jgi:enoyl-CoA hydratase/carnithine racemase